MNKIILGIFFLFFLSPHLYLLGEAFKGEQPSILIQSAPVAFGLLKNTLYLLAYALAIAIILGVSSAYLVTNFNFPGVKIFSILLCLPFAVPAYILAGIYASLNHYYGFPISIENTPGAGFVLGISLYPWIYLPLKTTFQSQGSTYWDLAQCLPLSPFKRFTKITLGLARPTIAACSMLVLMAVVSDFGVAQTLGVKTISVGIHDAMFNMYRKDWAAQLSLLGFGIPFIALLIYMYFYKRSLVFNCKNKQSKFNGVKLKTKATILVVTYLSSIIFVGIIVPVGILIFWAVNSLHKIKLDELPQMLWDTILFCSMVTLLTLLVAFILATLFRINKKLSKWKIGAVLINLNYAIPSVMLAISVMFMASSIKWEFFQEFFSYSIALVILGGFLQYLCFPYFTILNGYSNISSKLDDLSEVIGLSKLKMIFKIYIPLLKKPMAAGVLLVIVNILKELPISLVLQPFGFQTLSMRIYNYASVWMFQESAIYSLSLIACMIYPVISLNKIISGQNND